MALNRDYRAILRAILDKKKETNPRFSLRAFAMQIEITHSALNQIFKGTKNLSAETAARIARKLRMTPEEADHFCTLVQLDGAKDPELKKHFENKLKVMSRSRVMKKPVAADFELEWYHPVIGSMADLTVGEFTPKVVAKRLGLTPQIATKAMEQLEALGILKCEDGKWAMSSGSDYTLPGTPERLRANNRLQLARASASIDSQPLTERLNVSAHLAFPKARIPEARQIAHECVRRLQVLSDECRDNGEALDHVYSLIVNMFHETVD